MSCGKYSRGFSAILLFALISCKAVHCAQRLDCPNEWTPFSRFCYKVFTQLLHWEEAQQSCKSYGGELAVPYSEVESDFMWEMQKEYISDTGSPMNMWLGCSVGLSGEWKCSWDKHTEYMRELATSAGKQGCVNMLYKSGSWGAISCIRKRSYLCERSKCINPVRCFTVTTADPIEPDHCLLGHSFKEIAIQSPQQCCLICSKDPDCCSFNIFRKTCQLNNATLSQVDVADIGKDTNCVYYDYEE